MAKIIISENKLRKIITEELTKSDVIDIIKHDRDVENRVKDLVSKVIVSLYKLLYQNRSFYENQITRD